MVNPRAIFPRIARKHCFHDVRKWTCFDIFISVDLWIDFFSNSNTSVNPIFRIRFFSNLDYFSSVSFRMRTFEFVSLITCKVNSRSCTYFCLQRAVRVAILFWYYVKVINPILTGFIGPYGKYCPLVICMDLAIARSILMTAGQYFPVWPGETS